MMKFVKNVNPLEEVRDMLTIYIYPVRSLSETIALCFLSLIDKNSTLNKVFKPDFRAALKRHHLLMAFNFKEVFFLLFLKIVSPNF